MFKKQNARVSQSPSVKASAMLIAMMATGMSSSVLARGEITAMTTSNEVPERVSYRVNGVVYNWGTGFDRVLRGFEFNGRQYTYNNARADSIIVRRRNGQTTGRCSLFAEQLAVTSSVVNLGPSHPGEAGTCDYQALLGSGIINRGSLDAFTNRALAPNRNYADNDIERLDFLFSGGIVAPVSDLAASGHVILEKSGNNPVKIAAVTALDGEGNPASYGPMVMVHESTHGDANAINYGLVKDQTTRFSFMSTPVGQPSGNVHRQSELVEDVGAAFVSLRDLGIGIGQKYYGFSLFPTDVDASIHSLTNPDTFPAFSDVVGPGDADLQAGTAGNFVVNPDPNNAAPQAIGDSLSTDGSAPQRIDVLQNDVDPDGDTLTIVSVSETRLGRITIENGQLVFTSNGEKGQDSVTYQITDGFGNFSSATVDITVADRADGNNGGGSGSNGGGSNGSGESGTNNGSTSSASDGSAIIETGLQGNGGAVSLMLLLLPLLRLFRPK